MWTTPLEVTATALSLWGLVLNARQNSHCWEIWFLGSALWMVVFAATGQYWAFTQFTCYQVMNVYGYYTWIKKKSAVHGQH